MAATFYSSFFTSGFLAPHTPLAQMPRSSSPTTPRATNATLVLDDTTPPAHAPVTSIPDESQTLPSITVSDDSRPRLRRRRSSLAGASFPLTAMKSSTPIRNAAASVQRSLRARSGSDASIMSTTPANPLGTDSTSPKTASKPTTLVGRLRSGSVGTALRPRRGAGLRRAPTEPALPPPNLPLPAVPYPPMPSSAPSTPLPLANPKTPVMPRRPLARRAETFDNYDITSYPFSVAGASPMCLDDEDRDVFAAAAARHPPSPARLAFIRGAENAMQVDYPSPIEGSTVLDWAKQMN